MPPMLTIPTRHAPISAVERQRTIALQKANRTRRARRVLKGSIKREETTARTLLIDGPIPAYLETVTAKEFLRYFPQIGEDRATRICSTLAVKPGLRIEHMSQRTRLSLVEALEDRAGLRR